MPESPKKRPAEFYGEFVEDTSSAELMAAFVAEHCPFIHARCKKLRKSNSSQTIGTCTITYQKAHLIICPKRFLQAQQIFLDCVQLLNGKGRYYVIPEVGMPGGNIDYFLIVRQDDEIKDYLGIEIQSLDTTSSGKIWDARVDAVNGVIRNSYNFGINWKMSAKTILMQMHHKAPAFEQLGKKLVLVIQTEFLNYIEREFRSGHLRNADFTDAIRFHGYNCVNLGNNLSIVKVIEKSTNADGIERMLGGKVTDTITNSSVINRLQAKMGDAFELTPAR